MATRGRKPKPNTLKLLEGARADRLNPETPRPAAGRPECPDFLDDDARAEWDRIVAELETLGLLSRADRAALMLYCNSFSRWLRARRETLDVISSTAIGGDKANPAVAVEQAAEATMLRILAEFGLTPSSRNRVAALKPEAKESKLAAFLGKKKA